MKKKTYDTEQLNNLNIMNVAQQLDIRIGRDKKMLCFLHSEKTPSLSLDTNKNRWHCFGCGEGGGVLDLVMRYNGLSFSAACEWLENAFGFTDNASPPNRRASKPRKILSVTNDAPIDSELYSAIIDQLQLSNKASTYLCEDRALSETVVEQARIRSLDNVTAFYNDVISTYGESRLLAAGFLKVGKTGELKRSWWATGIVFPYYTHDGTLKNLQLRPYSSSRAKYIFLSGIPTAMYNEHLLKHWDTGDMIYLCEGAMDTLSLATKGIKAIGIPGANSFSDAWIDCLGRFNVTILFDNDDTGIKKAESYRARLSKKNINVQVQHIPVQYKDINEMLIAERNRENAL